MRNGGPGLNAYTGSDTQQVSKNSGQDSVSCLFSQTLHSDDCMMSIIACEWSGTRDYGSPRGQF